MYYHAPSLTLFRVGFFEFLRLGGGRGHKSIHALVMKVGTFLVRR